MTKVNCKSASDMADILKGSTSSSIIAGGLFVEMVLKQLMEDNVTPKIPLDAIIQANSRLREDQASQSESIIQLPE